MSAYPRNGTLQVDFYVLQDAQKSVEQGACELAMMVWEQGMHSFLVAPDSQQARQLDELMWSVPGARFLPHQMASESLQAPVTIGNMAVLDQLSVDVVINLDKRPVSSPERFRRLLELVPASDEDRQASRSKFRLYRQIGLNPVSHNMA